MLCGLCWGQDIAGLLPFSGCNGRARLEAEAIVSCLQDVATVGQTVEQSGGHLGVAKDCGPFAEA